MTPIDCMVYTKHRSLQLDLLLRSMKEYFLNVNEIHILYDVGDENHYKGLQKVMAKDYGLNISWRPQTRDTFESVIKDELNNKLKTHWVTGFCDDDVFIRPVDASEIIQHMSYRTNAISLRAAPTTTFCYALQKDVAPPTFEKFGNFLGWNWTKCDPTTDWGWPHHVDGSIYSRVGWANFINDLHFNGPNILEGRMVEKKLFSDSINLCFHDSKMINLSVNRVQNTTNNKFATQHFEDPDKLNQRWLDGEIIDTSNIYNMQNNCEFMEIEFKYIKG